MTIAHHFHKKFVSFVNGQVFVLLQHLKENCNFHTPCPLKKKGKCWKYN